MFLGQRHTSGTRSRRHPRLPGSGSSFERRDCGSLHVPLDRVCEEDAEAEVHQDPPPDQLSAKRHFEQMQGTWYNAITNIYK
jgi:hypothetical protein